MTNKSREMPSLPATVKPGDFPLGSMESRAATRAMISRRQDTGLHVRLIMAGHPPQDCKGTWCLSDSRYATTVGVCGLVSGRFFVNEEGEVEQPLKASA